jgi:phage FluMu gp28-like protein
MEISLFSPTNSQLSVINKFADSEHKFGIVSTGRQFGKSLLGQNLLLYWLLKNKGSKCGWVSPVYSQAKKVFDEITNASYSVITGKNKADLTINFINGSTIKFLSSERPDSIRGFSFRYLVIDEAAFVREQGLNESILPTLTAIGKKCLIISTPKSKNWFYHYWLKGQQNNPTYISFTGTSYDNPHADHEFIKEQQKSLPDDIYRQEYLAEFTDAGSEVFRNLDVACRINSYETSNKREKVYFGIDTALSSDYSVLSIMSESGRVLNIHRVNGKAITAIAQEFIQILSRYSIAGGYVETNGIGAAMMDIISPKIRKAKKWVMTQDSKMKIVRGMIEDLEAGEIELPSKELEPQCFREFSLYTYKLSPNGKLSFSHPSGEKDDMVDSLCMANYARNTMLRGSSIHIGTGNMNVVPKFGLPT